MAPNKGAGAGNSKRVLVVDDDQQFTSLLTMNLANAGGFEVFVENEADNVLDRVRHHKPDVILLDILMPHQTGLDVATELRSDSTLNTIPIIFLSAAVAEGEVRHWRSGVEGVTIPIQQDVIQDSPVLAKPAPVNTIIEAIRDACRH